MSNPAYIINLGSGLYLDSDGVMHQGDFPPVPAYSPPGGLLSFVNDASKLAKTFNDIGGELPNKSEGKKFEEFAKKLDDLGAPPELAKLLGAVGQIASVIGTVFVALGVAIAAAKLLGLFSEGPSPLESLVKARFDALDKEFRALQNLITIKDLRDQRDALITARSAVESFVSQRDSGTLTPAEIENRLQILVGTLSVISANQILNLLDPTTYMVFFDTSEHTKVWPWITNHLFLIPSGEAPHRAVFPVVNANVFDHRLAITLGPHAAQTFLGLMQSLSPEFRTTGDFRPQLRNVAEKLSDLAASLRNTGLARTIYTEADFSSPIDDFYVDDLIPGLTDPVLKPDYFLVVGAMDLCNHNDAFFSDVATGGGVPFPGPSRRGSLDFRWPPPAKLTKSPVESGFFHTDGSPVIQYLITNPKECADAANQQSEQDYADLLVSSGYMTLVQLSAQLQHAATQPDHSETVRGDVFLQRFPQPGEEVTVHSGLGAVLFTATGDIEARGWREAQKVKAFVSCTTQQVPRTRLVQYRVFLRTLSSAFPPSDWGEPRYEAVQSVNYIDDPLHPGFKRLVLATSNAAVLHEELLIEGSSQIEARHQELTLNFTAHTFDWWIPLKPIPGIGDTVFLQNNHLSALGKSAVGPNKVPGALKQIVAQLGDTISNDQSGNASILLGLGWEDGEQTWQGEHRETAETTVQVRVKLDWQADRLRVVIDNRPEDRNYILFLVVEETFGSIESDEHPPKVLHTALPIPINGQLTYVPQSFFDEEKEARDKQMAFASDFAVSAEPHLGDPVFGSILAGELTTDAGVGRLVAALQQFEPALLEKLVTGSFKNWSPRPARVIGHLKETGKK